MASRSLKYLPRQVVVGAFAGPETIPDELLDASHILMMRRVWVFVPDLEDVRP